MTTGDKTTGDNLSSDRRRGRRTGDQRKRPTRARRARTTTLPQLLAAAVDLDPTAAAVICDGDTTTYAELDAASSRLARLLIDHGVGPEDFVAVGVPRSLESVVAVWAVAKTGAAFMPVDPNYPIDRVAHMITDSGAVLGLAVDSVLTSMPTSLEWLVLDEPRMRQRIDAYSPAPVTYADRRGQVRAHNAAYVIYTSGSTGRPKGVVVSQAGLANFAAEQRERYRVTAASRVLMFASPSFDASVLELLMAVGSGAAMVVVPPTVYGGAELADLIKHEQATHTFLTPSVLASMDPTGLDDLEVVVAGGEAVPTELVTRWSSGSVRLHNGYGPTETTIMTNISDPLVPGAQVTIGGPIRGAQCYVLDSRLRSLPAGVAGELYLAGPGLARGYHARATLTAERFVANPFGEPGDRMYRTGDVVRWTDRSEVEYFGRNDFQVKIRGLRIELGEIDAALSAHRDVRFVATLSRTTRAGEAALVSYVLPEEGRSIDVGELTEFAARTLPIYMVPATVMVLDAIPLTANGKLDRNALPTPKFEARQFRAPSTPVEEIVAGVFADVLGIGVSAASDATENGSAQVGADDDFFELGGNSLMATRVAARVGAALDTRVPVSLVFEASTVAHLAVRLESHADTGRVALTARERPELMPLSFAQQRMWFLNQFDTQSGAYNIPIVIRLSGPLDVGVLRQAIIDVVHRHEPLRTVFPDHGGIPYQHVLPTDEAVAHFDHTIVGSTELSSAIAQFISGGIDVSAESPIRARLYAVDGSEQDHILAVVLHHISADGWSIGPLTRDVMSAYVARTRDEAPAWDPLPVQYADFALWQREVLGSEDDPESLISQQISYWTQQLADLPEQLDLPADRPRPTVATHVGARVVTDVEGATHAALVELARATNSTLFMVVHAALAVLLARLSSSGDIAVGTAIAGRGEAELDNLVGMFVNTLVLRTRIDAGASFEALLEDIRETDLAAFGNADVPFERLVELLDPPRSTSRHPLFQVSLAFETLAAPGTGLADLRIEAVDATVDTAKFDLSLTVRETAASQGLEVEWLYATDVFDHSTVTTLAERFNRVLHAAVEDPSAPVGDFPILDAAERADLVSRTGGTAEPGATLADLFSNAANSDPNRQAVVGEHGSLTYRELHEASIKLARLLIARGVGPGDVVALAMARSIETVRATWAVAAAGAAFLPIDPSYPHERIAHMVTDSGARLGLTTGFTRAGLPNAIDWLAVDDEATASRIRSYPGQPISDRERARPLHIPHPAYMIYTSGSTGTPKGVVVTHAGIGTLVRAQRERFATSPSSKVLAVASPSFDASVFEMLLAVGAGATLVVAPADVYAGEELAALARTEGVTHAVVTPSVLTTMEPRRLESVRVLITAGEALSVETVERWSPGRTLYNAYGPTETTIWATGRDALQPGRQVTIGDPIPGITSLVLDRRLHPVPVGVPGELYLAGVALARGYHDRPDLTAERFVADLFGAPGARLYRTGDLVRWTRDGEMEYLGRADFQVKVRGLRIELGEIDAALAAHESVEFAVTVGHTADRGGVSLVSYVVAAGRHIDSAVLRDFVADRLPAHMVPTAVVVLDAIPLTPNGKLDRKALPTPVFETRAFRAPRTGLEHTIAEVFADVLGVDRVGLDDSFFALGGDSIVSIQLVSRCKERGVAFTPRDVFEQRTVAGLATIAGVGGIAPAIELPELPGGGVGEMPLPPIVRFMVERPGGFNRFNQTVTLELPAALDRASLVATVAAVIDRHDMLRSRLYRDVAGEWRLETVASGAFDVDAMIHRRGYDAALDVESLRALAEADLDAALDRLDPANGIVVQFVWLDPSDGRSGRLIVAAHHIAVDGVSWRILIPDFVAAWAQASNGQQPNLVDGAPTGTSMRRWAHALSEAAMSPRRSAELQMWQQVSGAPDPLLGSRALDDSIDTVGTVDVINVDLSESQTRALLTTAPALFHAGVNDVLLTALAVAVVRWRRARGVAQDSALIRLEGHGREDAIVPGADLSTTVGWFTSIYPLLLDLTGVDTAAALDGTPAIGAAVKGVKEQLHAVPDKGMGYGLLRYLNPDTAPQLAGPLPGQISFNYLGRISAAELPDGIAGLGWLPASDLSGLRAQKDADTPAGTVVDINAIVTGERLSAGFAYPRGVIDAADVKEFASLWIRALAAIVQHANTAGAGGHTPSDFGLVRVGQRDIERWERDYGELTDVWPLAPLQAGMFFHAMLADASVDVYTAQVVLRLGGAADGDRLRAAATAIVQRYPNLRAAFVTDHTGSPCQVVPDGVELPWTVVDLRGPGGEERVEQLVAADRVRHFDLARPPLIRFTLARVDSGFVFISTNHHILLDGWSMPLLVRDLLVLYAARGNDSILDPVRPFRAYLEWVANRDPQPSRDSWRDALAGVDEPTLLAPSGRGRELDTVTAELAHVLDADLTAELSTLAIDLNVTVNTIVQVAWGIVLGHTVGRSDVVFGTTVSGRPSDLAGVESMVGLFINTVPVRVRFDPSDAVTDVLARVQAEQSGLLDHHHVNLAEIQATTGLEVLFDTLLVYESYPVNAGAISTEAANIDGMTIDAVEVSDAAHYPLTLVLIPGERLAVRAGYIPGLFAEATVRAIVQRLDRTLSAMARRPGTAIGDIDVLDAAERGMLLEQWSSYGPDTAADDTLVTRFERAVTAHADRTAVRSDGVELTYRELDERANRVARILTDAGVGPESLVAVALPRSLDLVVALLATLKAGGGYLPIDPTYPADRVEFMLDDARPVCVLTWSGREIAIPDQTPVLELDTLDLSAVAASRVTDAERGMPLRSSNVAYVIYTSGSTGRPKGVVVPHRNVVKLFDNTAGLFGFDESDVWTMFHSYAFDFSVWELWGPLLHGGVLVVVDYYVSRSPEQFRELLNRERVTVLNQTPSAFYQSMLTADGTTTHDLPALRYIVFGGEALELRRLTSWYARHGDTGPRLINMYGITETTVHVSHRELTQADATDDGRSLVGRAIPGLRSYLLDVRMRPVPIGVVGEMYVGGVQLARGYLGRPALTADRFVADPYGPPGTRLYRTGDRARWTAAGELEYIGRSDFQVKVRGFRIEPGEIEAALTDHDSVAQGAVVLRADEHTGDQLVAYVVPRPGTTLDTSVIRDHVADELPPYMVPSAFVWLESLPLTANGKLDRKALPAPALQASQYRAPSTALERQVADVFADVLGVDRVGGDDSFFDLGGNSIVAARAVALLRSGTGTDVRIQWFFGAPTVTGLSARIQQARVAGAGDEGVQQPAFDVVLPIRPNGSEPPLFCIHPIFGLAWPYSGLAQHLDNRPIYGLQSPAFTEDNAAYDSVDTLARRYVDEIRTLQPHGPYLLLGWSFGGVLAHAVATRLRAAGERIAALVILDSVLDIDDEHASREIRHALTELGATAPTTAHAPITLADAEVLHDALTAGTVDLPLRRVQALVTNAIRTPELINQYRPTELRADVVLLFEAAQDLGERPSARSDWQQFVDRDLHYFTVDATHLEMTSHTALQAIGPIIADHLDTTPL